MSGIFKKNNKGKILGIDLKKIEQIKGIKLIEGDFLDRNSKKYKKYFHSSIDLILSDMASNTTGNKSLDLYKNQSIMSRYIRFF